MQIHAYAAPSKSAPLTPYTYDVGEIGSHEVEIDITHCGICHSDLHLLNNDWGISSYPFVPGHEVIGTVASAGGAVRNVTIGARVGIGWQAGSCKECEWCEGKFENICSTAQPTCVGRPGGFANKIRVDSRFAFSVPDGLDSAEAAPLMCAGATMFTPLRDHDVTKGSRVGIVGLGGLGHIGVQFAHAMGALVTVFSSSPAKEKEARAFGANEFVNMRNSVDFDAAAGSQDLILSTASADLPWIGLMNALRPKGTLVLLGVPEGEFHVPVFPIIAAFKNVAGSNTGGTARIAEMLEFSAKHKIRPKIEKYPMPKVNDALERLGRGEVRYRVVLEA